MYRTVYLRKWCQDLEAKNTAAAKTSATNKRKSVTSGKETEPKTAKTDSKGVEKILHISNGTLPNCLEFQVQRNPRNLSLADSLEA